MFPHVLPRTTKLCLKASEGEEPFYLGYAYEALARAAKTAGDVPLQERYRTQAEEFAVQLPEGEQRDLLVNDLNSLVEGNEASN